MAGGAWWATVHGVAASDTAEQLTLLLSLTIKIWAIARMKDRSNLVETVS